MPVGRASSRAAGCRACFTSRIRSTKLRNGLGEDRVHVVPQPPLFQRPIHAAAPAGKTIAETVEVGVEIVVLHDKNLLIGMIGVVVGQVADDLQSKGRLARSFFAEHHGGGRLFWIAVYFVPGGMIGGANARPFEDQVGLGVFIGEGIGCNPVMFEELLDFHGPAFILMVMLA